MQLVSKTDLPKENTQITQPNDKITLDIGGMKCAGCVRAVERTLTQYPGIISSSVNLATSVAVVESSGVNADELAKHLTAAGYPSQPRYSRLALKTSNLQDQDSDELQRQEMRSLSKNLFIAGLLLALSSLGHFSSVFDAFFPGLDNIWFHCGLATLTLLIPGRPILIDGFLGVRRGAPNMNTLIALGSVTAYTASLVALLFPLWGWECFFDEPVMMLGFILLGRTLEQRARGRAAAAFKNLLQLQPQVARLVGKPKEIANQELDNSQPSSVSVSSHNIVEIPAEQVRVGEWLQVLPGEKIPVDGEIVQGQTTVDESMLTGEAVPVIKQPKDSVTAGTLNQSGAIIIGATRTGSDTTVAQIIALVEAAQTRKAPIQKIADTVAGYFTYFVLTAALLTFGFWYFFGAHIWTDIAPTTTAMAHHSPLPTLHSPLSTQHSALNTLHSSLPTLHSPLSTQHSALNTLHSSLPTLHSPLSTQHSALSTNLLLSLKLAIAVMVVACPCALGLATPTAILVGTAMGAERGLLIKGGDVLEKVHKLNTVVFDKTGTLTSGKPTVCDCILIEEIGEDNLLKLAAAVESGTCHPIATAIQSAVQKQQLIIPDAVDFHTEAGLGVSAKVEGKLVYLGNSEWLSWHGITIVKTAQDKASALANAGKTVVYLASDDKLTGIIAVTDTLRPEAKTTVEQLRQMGLRVMILSGDRIEAVTNIAKQLGIDTTDVIAGVPPAKKAQVIQVLQQRECTTAMVGDGINDAPALSQADVGIALHSGTDVAMETASIVLMRDCLTDVTESIKLSRATFNKIRQNLFWAFAYNTIGIPLAAGILLPKLGFILNPAGAAALMAFSSVSVVTNSLLLRRFPRS
jgi:P-type Cu2+ transporter